VGGTGARHAIEHGFAPDRAVVVEGSTGYSAPGVTDVAVAHRGRREHRVRAPGAAAHASEADAGENAIYRACEAVAAVRGAEPASATVWGEEIAGSAVVTEIDGGTAANVVPDACTFTVDERTVPDATPPMDTVDLAGCTAEATQAHPAMACDDAAFADRALAAAASVQDGAPEQVIKPHATDAGLLAEAGTSCLVVGPAEPGEAHTADESVSVAVLERCRRLYRAIAERTA
jgi:acetylornithine deacetylase